MRETISVWSILLLCMLLTAIAQPSFGATKETPLEYGKEYTINGESTKRWYIDVNCGDNITVNVSKVVSYYCYVNIDPTLRYSSSSNDSLLDASGTTGTGMLSPFTFWFVCAHSQLIWLEFKTQVISSSPSMTYNITRVNGTVSQMPEDLATLKQDLAALNSTLANLTAAFLANLTAVNDTLADLWNNTATLNASVKELNETLVNLNESLRALVSDIYEELSWQSQNITWLWENLTRIGGDLDSLGLREMADYDSLTTRLAALNASLLEAYSALRALMETNDTALRGLLEANNASLSGELSTLADFLADLHSEVQNISFPAPEQYNDTLLWKEISRLNATPLYNDTPLRTEIAGLKGDLSTIATTVNNTSVPTSTSVYINKTVEGKDNTVTAVVSGVVAGIIASTVSAVAVAKRRKNTP